MTATDAHTSMASVLRIVEQMAPSAPGRAATGIGSRNRRLVLSRSLAAAALRHCTQMSWPEIAALSGYRSHASAIAASRRVQRDAPEMVREALWAIRNGSRARLPRTRVSGVSAAAFLATLHEADRAIALTDPPGPRRAWRSRPAGASG